jgi:hypothetical protein
MYNIYYLLFLKSKLAHIWHTWEDGWKSEKDGCITCTVDAVGGISLFFSFWFLSFSF